ncbi:MAG: hypothetical protein H7146_02185 [Burkholderiaceae bacterium]|nr:hypothetical protein [Microbacteriaceae bacterium]
MRIQVVRSGGIAGLKREWNVDVDAQEDCDDWHRLIDELPWNPPVASAPQPDRYVYRITMSRRLITLREGDLTGPWRQLVDRVRRVAD